MTIVAGRGARALCEALAEGSLTIERRDDGLVVTPARLVDDALLAQLRRYKAELLGALKRAERAGRWAALRPCPCCDAEFLAGGELRCPWCDAAGWGSDDDPGQRGQPASSVLGWCPGSK